MVPLRKSFVFALLLIIVLGMVAAPVSAASSTLDRHPAIKEMINYLDPANATRILKLLDDTETTSPATVSAVIVPESASLEAAIGPADSIQAAIDAAPAGSTIYLNPGTYTEHDIQISKNIRIQANPSAGGSRSNTIIDAGNMGRIFNVTGPYTVSIDNLALQNGEDSSGTRSTRGGAILTAEGSSLTITSSTFSDCLAQVSGMGMAAGGAIYSGGRLTVTSSSFEDCSAVGYISYGGAIFSDYPEYTAISSSSFTGCTSEGMMSVGGAVAGADSITSSTFTDCGTNGYLSAGGAVFEVYTLQSSTFVNCRASGEYESIGGAVAVADTVSSSTFEDCSVMGSMDALMAEADSVTDMDVAPAGGGAIYDVSSVTSSSFIRCSALGEPFMTRDTPTTGSGTSESLPSRGGGIGGAIFQMSGPLTVTSSTFTSCSALGGGAIFAEGPVTVHFSRFYQNTALIEGPAIIAMGVYDTSATGTSDAIPHPVTADATNNWWGNNSDPAEQVYGPVTTDPWLVLNITAMPLAITPDQTADVRTSLTRNSYGTDTSGLGHVPDGITNTFAMVSGSGSVSPLTDGTTNGIAETTFSSATTGTDNISATVDDQTVYLGLSVYNLHVTTPDTSGNDDGFPPQAFSPAPTGEGALPLMTVIVNIGGDSKAWQAIVTGTKLSGLIVTGTVQHGPGDNQTAPPGIVFQYISLVPARYDTVTKGVINFTVPQSWLDEHHIAPGSIVLYHQTANGWAALPTTVLYTKDGTVYFSAQTPAFSLFAIAGTPAAATPATIATTQGVMNSGVQVQPPAPAAMAKTPAVTQTTVPPAAPAAPAGSSAFPVLPALIGVGCVGLIGGGVVARRWWVRRKNPALFREYD
jgi:hypothetical protein